MRSATDHRTARARILDSSLQLFADHGATAVTVRDIARAAEVSPGLVIHHFGSKAGLRTSVDAEAMRLVREMIGRLDRDAATSPTGAFFKAMAARPDVLAYIARAVAHDDEFSRSMVDQMVAEARTRLDEAAREGWVVPSDDPEMRALLVTFYDLGVLILRDHVRRLTGEDLLGEHGGERWMRAAMQIYTEGLFR